MRRAAISRCCWWGGGLAVIVRAQQSATTKRVAFVNPSIQSWRDGDGETAPMPLSLWS